VVGATGNHCKCCGVLRRSKTFTLVLTMGAVPRSLVPPAHIPTENTLFHATQTRGLTLYRNPACRLQVLRDLAP
jgi:hypothetical protein